MAKRVVKRASRGVREHKRSWSKRVSFM